MEYRNGKIYKIESKQTDKIYIGSTKKTLEQRMSNHNDQKRLYELGKYHFCQSFKILDYDDAKIVLIEDYPCESKAQLRKREQFHLDLNRENIVNEHRAYTDMKEYIKKYNKENKEYLKKYRGEKIQCDCGIFISRSNISYHRKTQRHIDIMK